MSTLCIFSKHYLRCSSGAQCHGCTALECCGAVDPLLLVCSGAHCCQQSCLSVTRHVLCQLTRASGLMQTDARPVIQRFSRYRQCQCKLHAYHACIKVIHTEKCKAALLPAKLDQKTPHQNLLMRRASNRHRKHSCCKSENSMLTAVVTIRYPQHDSHNFC